MPIRKSNFKPNWKINKILVCGFFVIVLFFIWKNILILDDLHHNFHENFDSNPASMEDSSAPSQSGADSNDANQPDSELEDTAYHIHINLDIKQVYLYKDGQLLRTFPCSGGKPDTPSPEGTWKVISKDTWGEGFGGSWLGINVPWGTLFLEYS